MLIFSTVTFCLEVDSFQCNIHVVSEDFAKSFFFFPFGFPVFGWHLGNIFQNKSSDEIFIPKFVNSTIIANGELNIPSILESCIQGKINWYFGLYIPIFEEIDHSNKGVTTDFPDASWMFQASLESSKLFWNISRPTRMFWILAEYSLDPPGFSRNFKSCSRVVIN